MGASIQALVSASVSGAEVPASHVVLCTLNVLPGSPPDPQGVWLPAAGWPWVQLVCEKDLCEKAVKSLMGGLCPSAQDMHLSSGPALGPCLIYFADMPVLSLVPCWFCPCLADFLLWPGTCITTMDLPSDHRTVVWTWLPSSDLLCSCSGTVGLHPYQCSHCPTCVVTGSCCLASLVEEPTLAVPWQWALRPRQHRWSESLPVATIVIGQCQNSAYGLWDYLLLKKWKERQPVKCLFLSLYN